MWKRDFAVISFLDTPQGPCHTSSGENLQSLESLPVNPDQADTIFVRFRSAHALRRRASLAACEAEFLALWELLPTEHLSPKAVETLLKLNAAIETGLQPQTLLDGPSMADELIKERRAEAERES